MHNGPPHSSQSFTSQADIWLIIISFVLYGDRLISARYQEKIMGETDLRPDLKNILGDLIF